MLGRGRLHRVATGRCDHQANQRETVRFFHRSFSGMPGLTCTLSQSRTYTRIYLAKAVTLAKGIYDVAAFERSLAGQVRENTLLSHDLFEGIYGKGRAGHGHHPL